MAQMASHYPHQQRHRSFQQDNYWDTRWLSYTCPRPIILLLLLLLRVEKGNNSNSKVNIGTVECPTSGQVSFAGLLIFGSLLILLVLL